MAYRLLCGKYFVISNRGAVRNLVFCKEKEGKIPHPLKGFGMTTGKAGFGTIPGTMGSERHCLFVISNREAVRNLFYAGRRKARFLTP